MKELMKVEQQVVKGQKKKKGGFTLVELIVVIAIIAILAALLIPMVSKYIGQATDARNKANARALYTAGAAYGAELIAEGKDAKGTYNTKDDKELNEYLGDIKGYGEVIITSTGAVDVATWWPNGERKGDFVSYPK